MEQIQLENIKKELLATYATYIGTSIPYTDEELSKASIQIKGFLDKLNNMRIYENSIPRKLNNLELFVAIYEFVANRVYVEQDTSHDIIGTLITNKGVCQGYCQLMSFLCESFNIPFLYKHTETFDENRNPLGSHGNFEVIVQDEIVRIRHGAAIADTGNDRIIENEIGRIVSQVGIGRIGDLSAEGGTRRAGTGSQRKGYVVFPGRILGGNLVTGDPVHLLSFRHKDGTGRGTVVGNDGSVQADDDLIIHRSLGLHVLAGAQGKQQRRSNQQ